MPWGKLYDLAQDPNETRNLWDSSEHSDIRAHFSERMVHHLIAQIDDSLQADRLA
jgi:hypothetical protein